MGVEIKGMDELLKKFNNLSKLEQSKIVKSATKKAAEYMKDEQINEVPFVHTKYSGALTVKQAKGSNGLSYYVGINDTVSKAFNDVYDRAGVRRAYFHYHGFGTLKKWSKSKRKTNRKYPSKAKVFYHAPDLWMDRAFDKSVAKATEIVRKGIVDAIKSK